MSSAFDRKAQDPSVPRQASDAGIAVDRSPKASSGPATAAPTKASQGGGGPTVDGLLRVPQREGEPDTRSRHRGDEGLRLGQEDETDRKPGGRRPRRVAAALMLPEEEDRRDRKREPVRRLVGIGRNVVVVPDEDDLSKREDGQEDEARCRGANVAGHVTQQAVKHEEEGDKDREVAPHERSKADTEQREPDCVHVRRERPVEGLDVAVQHVAFRQPPRHIQLATEVDLHVGPGAPTPREHDDARHGQGGGPAPTLQRRGPRGRRRHRRLLGGHVAASSNPLALPRHVLGRRSPPNTGPSV